MTQRRTLCAQSRLYTFVLLCVFFIGCAGDLSTDKIIEKAPESCKQLCDQYIFCEFSNWKGEKADEAEASAADACKAVCYWAVKEGTYAYSIDDDYERQIDTLIEGKALKKYLNCLAEKNLYSCDQGYFSIDSHNQPESTCLELNECVGHLGIDLAVEYYYEEEWDYSECLLKGDEAIWPNILLGLYWDWNEDDSW